MQSEKEMRWQQCTLWFETISIAKWKDGNHLQCYYNSMETYRTYIGKGKVYLFRQYTSPFR